jgi:hypothetical protein
MEPTIKKGTTVTARVPAGEIYLPRKARCRSTPWSTWSTSAEERPKAVTSTVGRTGGSRKGGWINGQLLLSNGGFA